MRPTTKVALALATTTTALGGWRQQAGRRRSLTRRRAFTCCARRRQRRYPAARRLRAALGVTTAPNSYSATIAVNKAGAAGPTVTFALTAGSLPPGLTMPAQSGSGTVTGNKAVPAGTGLHRGQQGQDSLRR